MPRNEEGEYELVLGNRQLLSIIFIIMVLGGVVFSLGYFMGRNSMPEPPPPATAARSPVPEAASPPRLPATTASQPATAPASHAPSAPGADAPLEPGQAKVAALGTAPASGPPVDQKPPAQAPVRPQAASSPAPGVESKTAPPAAPAEAARRPVGEMASREPAAGQIFLQVAAVKRPEAELIVDVLKKKGFRAVVAPGPTDTLFRVLVGPFQESTALAKTKADLETAGFRSIVRKY